MVPLGYCNFAMAGTFFWHPGEILLGCAWRMGYNAAMTLKEYFANQHLPQDFQQLLFDILSAVISVSASINLEQVDYAGSQNVHGEKQLKLDIIANDTFVEMLVRNRAVSLLASEEMELPVEGSAGEKGYSVAFDPLDGSSLVDVNLAIGSIVSVYKGQGFTGRKCSEQVAALIAVYGPKLSFMITLGNGVNEFIYDDENGEFILNQEKLKIADEYKMFAPGNLRACASEKWYLLLLEHWVKNGYTLRYSGGMVPDVNQILKKGGGVFTYPGYGEQPKGKLRLLYECAPMAFLVEQAGGVAVSDTGRILDIEIKDLHQKTPIFLGSKKEVELVKSFMK
jgi:fructose-1,6-bisphosphatase I